MAVEDVLRVAGFDRHLLYEGAHQLQASPAGTDLTLLRQVP